MRRLIYNTIATLIILSFLIVLPYARAIAEPADTIIVPMFSGDNTLDGTSMEKVTNYPIIERGDPLQGENPTVNGEVYENWTEMADEESQMMNNEETDLSPEEDYPETPLHNSTQTIRANGNFNDWWGLPNLGDLQGDSLLNNDIKAVYWGTNDRESNLYFMIERYKPASAYSAVKYTILFDINDNGRYSDSADMRAEIDYYPLKQNKGYVHVIIFNSNGSIADVYGGQWGAGYKDFATKCELYIPMDSLGINAHQPIRFYLTSGIRDGSDRLPDNGDIQWAPVPASGKLGLAAIFMGGIIILIKAARSRKQC